MLKRERMQKLIQNLLIIDLSYPNLYNNFFGKKLSVWKKGGGIHYIAIQCNGSLYIPGGAG